MDDDYDEIGEFLEILYGERETPSLLGDAETTRPLNINARPEPLPSQVQDQPPRPQLPLSSRSHDLQDLDDQSRLFEYNEPNVSLCETRNRTAQFQRGHSQSQELNTPFEAESVNSLFASTETDQNLYTVPPHNFGYGEPIGSLCETSNRTYQLQRGHSQSQELHTPSVDQAESVNSLLASIDVDQLLQTLFTLPPLNIGFNEPSGGSSVAADSSQQQFSANLPMWHQNQLNIGSFDPGASPSTDVSSPSSSANQHEQVNSVVPPYLHHPLTIDRSQDREEAKQRYLEKKSRRKFMKPHRYESRSNAAVKKKRKGGKFVKEDDEFGNDPPAQQ